MQDPSELPARRVIDRIVEERFTGVLRVSSHEASGELWFLAGILEEARFGVSKGDEALGRLMRATQVVFQAELRLPHLSGGFKKPMPRAGSFAEARPVVLMRYCESNALTCTLELRGRDRTVRIAYRIGELVSADAAAAGNEALAAMLESEEGSYEIVLPAFELPPGVNPVSATATSVPKLSLAERIDRSLIEQNVEDAKAAGEVEGRARREAEAAEAAEAKRKADQASAAADAKRKADEGTAAAAAEAKRKADAATAAEAKRKADAATAAEAKRKADEAAAAAAAEAKRKADEAAAEAKRKADEAAAEAKRKADEAAAAAAAEAKRKADEAAAAQAKRDAEEAAAEAEAAEAKRKADEAAAQAERDAEEAGEAAQRKRDEVASAPERAVSEESPSASEREGSEPPPVVPRKGGFPWLWLLLALLLGLAYFARQRLGGR
jgi:hypothetical protein